MIQFSVIRSVVLVLLAFTGAASGQSALRSFEQLAKLEFPGTELLAAKPEALPAAASLPAD